MDAIRTEKYENKNGDVFTITILPSPDHSKSDAYLFTLNVTKHPDKLTHNYKCFFKKDTWDYNDAYRFVQDKPLEALQKHYLDYYSEGATPMYFPEFHDGWTLV